MNKAFLAHYRCSPQAVSFNANEDLVGPADFFQFGQAITCYGRTASHQPSRQFTDGQVQLKFDPDEVVENLRRERYPIEGRRFLSAPSIFRKLYYALRPVVPRELRKQFQRMAFSGWDKLLFPDWPVDFTVENILEAMMRLAIEADGGRPIPFIWFWPDAATAAVTLTHDIETESGLDFCGCLLDLDQRWGVRASFQLVPEKRYKLPLDLIETMRSRCFEVNVHDLNHDGHLFSDRHSFLKRAAKINAYGAQLEARGFRSACMYRNADWHEALQFSYDMSIPNVAHLEPQRGGCCTVMPFFIGNLLELPLTTVEDYALFYYLRERNIDFWRLQSEMIRLRHGLISFVVHPDYIQNTRELQMYLALLKHIDELRNTHGVWLATPGEIDGWWRKRADMNLVQTPAGWSIEGKDSERACIAYASVENNRLFYRLETPDQREQRCSTTLTA